MADNDHSMSDTALSENGVSEALIDPARKARVSVLPRHIKSLDGLRGIAILMVLMVHFMPPRPTASFAGEVINNLWTLGYSGVDLFFVLSGFLITGILLDAKGSAGYFRNFYARRALRIFPLYYGVLLLGTLVVAKLGIFRDELPAGHTWWWWLYVPNVRYAMFQEIPRGWFGVFWSLAVEEHFYLVWPAVICFCNRRWAIGISIACIILATLIRMWCAANGNFIAAYVLTPCRMDALAAGALVALTLGKRSTAAAVESRLKLVGVICGGLSLLLILWRYAGPALPIKQFLAMPLATCAYACLIAIVSRPESSNGVRRALESPMLRTVGKYSYGMYVLQFIVRSVMNMAPGFPTHLFPDRFLRANDAINFLILSGATLFAAYLSWHLCEKHFLRLKRFFEYAPRETLPLPNARRRTPHSGVFAFTASSTVG